MPSDDENESGESEVYTIVSDQGLEYDSTETISDLIWQIRTLLLGDAPEPKATRPDMKMLRALVEDLHSLVSVNPDAQASDTLDVLDGLDGLPGGWEAEQADDDGEE